MVAAENDDGGHRRGDACTREQQSPLLLIAGFEQGIVTGGAHGKLRWVTHLDIDDEAIERVRRVCKEFFGR